jgi:hypothetical protein
MLEATKSVFEGTIVATPIQTSRIAGTLITVTSRLAGTSDTTVVLSLNASDAASDMLPVRLPTM